MASSPLPSDFLKGRRWKKVKLADLVTLIHNLHTGAANPEVGFEDAGNTLKQITNRLNRKVWVDPSVLESGLWSCNLLNERGEFWDYKGRTFDELIKEVVGTANFDRFFNTIEDNND